MSTQLAVPVLILEVGQHAPSRLLSAQELTMGMMVLSLMELEAPPEQLARVLTRRPH